MYLAPLASMIVAIVSLESGIECSCNILYICQTTVYSIKSCNNCMRKKLLIVSQQRRLWRRETVGTELVVARVVRLVR